VKPYCDGVVATLPLDEPSIFSTQRCSQVTLCPQLGMKNSCEEDPLVTYDALASGQLAQLECRQGVGALFGPMAGQAADAAAAGHCEIVSTRCIDTGVALMLIRIL
jgi:hypothetical protein